MITVLPLDTSPDIFSPGLQFDDEPLSIISAKVSSLFQDFLAFLVALFTGHSEKIEDKSETAALKSRMGSYVQTILSRDMYDNFFDRAKNTLDQGYPIVVDDFRFQMKNSDCYSNYAEEVNDKMFELKRELEEDFPKDRLLQMAILTSYGSDLFGSMLKDVDGINVLLKAERMTLIPCNDRTGRLDTDAQHPLQNKVVRVKKSDQGALITITRSFRVKHDLGTVNRVKITESFTLRSAHGDIEVSDFDIRINKVRG